MIAQPFSRLYRICAALALISVFLLAISASASAHALRIGGTGGSLAALSHLGEAFAAEHPGLDLVVLPGMGSGGGVRALVDGAIDIAVTGRPLRENERLQGSFIEIPFARTPVALVTSYRQEIGLTIDQAVRMVVDPLATWPDGTPVRVIVRPESESDYRVIETALPALHQAFLAARQQPDVPAAADDQLNVELALHMPGSLTVTTLLQVRSELLCLRLLPIDGAAPTVLNMNSGTYPLGKTFFLIVPRHASDLVQAFIDFLGSRTATIQLRRLGALPPG